jgi:hypothetical protein
MVRHSGRGSGGGSDFDVTELVGGGVVESEGGGAEASHEFARVCPESALTNLMDVLPVIVTAEDGVVGLGFGEAFGDVRVVVESDVFSVDLEFGELAMESDVIVFGGDGAEEEGIAVVVAKDGIDGAIAEAIGHGGETEGSAEITEEEEAFGVLFFDEGKGGFEVVEAVVDIGEDGEEHGEPVFSVQ